jgi:hypothetical protein
MSEDSSEYIVTFGPEALSVTFGADTTGMGGTDEQGVSWSLSFPSNGTDPTWVEDVEQPHENWRSYHTRDGWCTLTVRHDACVDFAQAANIPFWIGDHKLTTEERDRINHDCDDSIHICNVTSFVSLMQSIIPLAEAWGSRSR